MNTVATAETPKDIFQMGCECVQFYQSNHEHSRFSLTFFATRERLGNDLDYEFLIMDLIMRLRICAQNFFVT